MCRRCSGLYMYTLSNLRQAASLIHIKVFADAYWRRSENF